VGFDVRRTIRVFSSISHHTPEDVEHLMRGGRQVSRLEKVHNSLTVRIPASAGTNAERLLRCLYCRCNLVRSYTGSLINRCFHPWQYLIRGTDNLRTNSVSSPSNFIGNGISQFAYRLYGPCQFRGIEVYLTSTGNIIGQANSIRRGTPYSRVNRGANPLVGNTEYTARDIQGFTRNRELRIQRFCHIRCSAIDVNAGLRHYLTGDWLCGLNPAAPPISLRNASRYRISFSLKPTGSLSY